MKSAVIYIAIAADPRSRLYLGLLLFFYARDGILPRCVQSLPRVFIARSLGRIVAPSVRIITGVFAQRSGAKSLTVRAAFSYLAQLFVYLFGASFAAIGNY
jgi:hypothetical protein